MTSTALCLDTPNVRSPEILGSDAESRFAACAQASDQMTQVALEFFEAKDYAASKAAFDRLLALVFNARQSLFLTERGLTWFDATHEFLEAWLVDQLLPYCNAGNVYEAAQQGKFRYLGKRGRNAIIDELRRRARSKDPLDRTVVRLDVEIDDAEKGKSFSWHDLLGVDYQQEVVCPIGTKPSLERSALRQKLGKCRSEIVKKLGEPLFEVLSTVCGLFPDHLSLGDVTRAIAKSRAVSEQTARKLHHALANKLGSLKGDPLVRGLVEIIRSVGDPIPLSTDTWDPLSQSVTPD